MASIDNPIFTVKAITASGSLEYDLIKSKVITELTYSDNPDSLAKEASITVRNALYNGKNLSLLLKPKDKLYIYADVGNGKFEVFRGVIWERDHESDTEKLVTFTAYDYLIWCMKSEDWFYYKKGLSTKTIIKKICSAWSLKLKYSYGSIKNARIKPVKNNIGDMMVSVLNKAKKKLNKRYILTIEGSTVIVKYTGKNSTIYTIEEGKNAISSDRKTSMEDTVTKIKIYGEEKKKSVPKLATVKKNTSKYGTIQMVMDKEKKEKLSKIKKEATSELKKKAKLQYTQTVTAISNPKIKRGDKVYVHAGSIKGNKIVKSISHDCIEGTMELEFY